jgi:hypothetical protein
LRCLCLRNRRMSSILKAMSFETEQKTSITLNEEPRILGVEVDPNGEAAKLWDEYIGENRFSAADKIVDLWADPEVTNPVIRQRAITVITAPAGNDIELPYVGPYPAHRHNNSLDLIEGKPYLAKEYAAGIMFWIDFLGQERGPEARVDAQIKYLYKILHVMANSDEKNQEQILDYYPVGDPDQYRYQNLKYGNLKHLIAKPGVADKYKQAALKQWSEIVKNEAATADMVDGIDYQDFAIVQMAELLDNQRLSDSVSPDLQEEIVHCIESNWPSDRSYIEDSTMRKLYALLEDEDLRFKLAYRNIAPPPIDEHHVAFGIASPEDIEMVEWVRAEARKRGIISFESRAEGLYQEYENRQKNYQARREREQDLRDRLHRLG